VALYYSMGLGKTFIGAELLVRHDNRHSLVVCQKSKLHDWLDHFETYYPSIDARITLTEDDLSAWVESGGVAIVNYDLLSRRPILRRMRGHCLLLDESSLVQNESAKRTKVVLSMSPAQVILLSGTPTGGKYERLWTQMRLLGWSISKADFWDRYIQYRVYDQMGFPLKIVTGYRNVDDLKEHMHEHGARFLRAEDVMSQMPSQTFIPVHGTPSPEYRKMLKTGIAMLDGKEVLGDTALTERLYLREISTVGKGSMLADILDSTEERVIVFYNFQRELYEALSVVHDRPIAIMNGQSHDLSNYTAHDNSVTLVQYQSGAMGLNLQKSRLAVFMSPPESSELYEQAKARTHRIGQTRPCVYYQLVTTPLESSIYSALALRKDYTDELFRLEYGSSRKAVRDQDKVLSRI